MGALAALSTSYACRDLVRPVSIVLQSLTIPADSVVVGTPGRRLTQPLVLRMLDADGNPVRGAAVRWTLHGTGASLDSVSVATDSSGRCAAVWIMGTKAGETQAADVEVVDGRNSATLQFRAELVPSEVATLVVRPDTPSVGLGTAANLQVQALDPFGNTVAQPRASYKSLDTTLATVDSIGTVQGRKRGTTRVVVAAQEVRDTTPVRVMQVVQAIRVSTDTLSFSALGAALSDSVWLVDLLGQDVEDSLPAVSVSDTTVATVTAGGPLTVRSRANGMTTVQLTVGSVQRQVAVLVGQQVRRQVVTPDSITLRLGLADTLKVTAMDSLGNVVAQPGTVFRAVDTAVVSVDSLGVVRGRSRGSGRIMVTSQGIETLAWVHVVQVVQAIRVGTDTLRFSALGAVQSTTVQLVDDLGQVVLDSAPAAAVGDTTVAALVPPGPLTVRSRGNGTTPVQLSVGGVQQLVTVQVAQHAVRLVVLRETLQFHALAQSQHVSAIAYDSLGSQVPGSPTGLTVQDTTIAVGINDSTLVSRRNGSTTATFTLKSLPGQVALVVAQVPATLSVTVASPNPILTLPVGAAVPVTCQALDSNGVALSTPPVVAASSTGAIAGTSCAALRVQRSGVDTLRVSLGAAQDLLPVAVAVPPVVSPAVADSLEMDSLPTWAPPYVVPAGFYKPWVPSLRRNSRGQLELYVALKGQFSNAWEDLHRYVSDDGVHFRYDGVVLRHDASGACTPLGFGIENVAIVARADGPGWRMFFAGGSFNCYGWQVFSAVSADERNWTIENGVRAGNGGAFPPATPVPVPWPVGEGIVVDQLAAGEWRMLVGGFRHVTPPENKWQIVEWLSPDQLNWTYVGPVLTTQQMPSEADAAVYCPTIRQFAPGMWRMVFTGDDRDQPGGRSRLWSAVSTDEKSWQVEGLLMADDPGNLFYAALVENTLVTMRDDTNADVGAVSGSARRIAIATILMP